MAVPRTMHVRPTGSQHSGSQASGKSLVPFVDLSFRLFEALNPCNGPSWLEDPLP